MKKQHQIILILASGIFFLSFLFFQNCSKNNFAKNEITQTIKDSKPQIENEGGSKSPSNGGLKSSRFAMATPPNQLILELKTSSSTSFDKAFKRRTKNPIISLLSKFKISDVKRISGQFENDSLAVANLKNRMEHNQRKSLSKGRKKRVGLASSNTVLAEKGSRFFLVTLEKPTDLVLAWEYLRKSKSPDLLSVSFNYPQHTVGVEMNDPYLLSKESWNQSYEDLWGLKKISADQVWDLTQGETIVVAVVDSGVDYNHPDLAANIWMNLGEVEGNGIDDDQNGFIDDVRGWNFTANNNNTMDDNLHGTHVAGTIAAVGNNGIGIVGIAPHAKIMPVKVLDASGSGWSEDIANGLRYAADNGADVINVSIGCSYRCPSDPVIEAAVIYAQSQGSIVVYAAGNSSDDASFFSPVNMIEGKPIVVAASDSKDNPTSFSNFGPTIDVIAPGGGSYLEGLERDIHGSENNILSLLTGGIAEVPGYLKSFVVGNQYLRIAGTSMAAPHVAGAVALILGNNFDLTVKEVKAHLFAGADDFGEPGFDSTYGFGRVNLKRTIEPMESPKPLVRMQISKEQNLSLGSIKIFGTAYSSNLRQFEIFYGLGSNPSNWISTGITGFKSVIESVLGKWQVPKLTNTSLTFKLVVTDINGEVTEKTQFVVLVMPENKGFPVEIPMNGWFNFQRNIINRADLNHDNNDELIYSNHTVTWWNMPGRLYSLNFDGKQTMIEGLVVGQIPLVNKIIVNRHSQDRVYIPAAIVGPDTNYIHGISRFDSLNTSKFFNVDAFNWLGDNLLGLLAILPDSESPGLLQSVGFTKLTLTDDDGKVQKEWTAPVLEMSDRPQFAIASMGKNEDQSIFFHADAEFSNSAVKPWSVMLSKFSKNGQSQTSGFPLEIAAYSLNIVLGDVIWGEEKEIIVAPVFGYNLGGSGEEGFGLGGGEISVIDSDGRVFNGWPKTLPYGDASVPGSLVLADIDGNGKLDIVVGVHKKSRRLDSFPRDEIQIWDGNGNVLPGWPQKVEGDIKSLVVGDYDSDGVRDIFVATQSRDSDSSSVIIYNANGKKKPLGFHVQDRAPGSLLLSDLNHDGILELAMSSYKYIHLWSLSGFYNPRFLDWPMFGQNPTHSNAVENRQNHQPVMIKPETMRIGLGQPLSLAIKAKDQDVDSLFFIPRSLPPGASFQTYLREDINADGVVDDIDMQYVKERLGSEEFREADINNDGIVDLRDYSLIETKKSLRGHKVKNEATFNWQPQAKGLYKVFFSASDGTWESNLVTFNIEVI